MITGRLIEFLREQFALDWMGIHGAPHWVRVLENGRRLAHATGARLDVVELFSVLHDARRFQDWGDREHGERAAELAIELRGDYFELDDEGLRLLTHACRGHSLGGRRGAPTVLTAWDADRLDLGRVGIRPSPLRLCTAEAKRPETVRWAWERSGEIPEIPWD